MAKLGRPSNLTPEDIKEIVIAYEARVSPADLAIKYKTHRSNITKALNAEGIDCSARVGNPGLPEEKQLMIVSLKKNGLGSGAIAERVGCSKQSVYSTLRRRGLIP